MPADSGVAPSSSGPLPAKPRRSWWRRRLIVYPLAFLAVVAVMPFAGCADMLLLVPTTDQRPCGAERLAVPLNGGVVEVLQYRVGAKSLGEPAVYVLEFGGNAERAEGGFHTPIEFVRNRNAEIWRINLPGYGGSTGPARLRAIPPAALAAFDALHSAAGGKPIIVLGNSIGGTAALYVASQRSGKVAGLVLRNPPPLKRLIIGHYGWWNLWLPAMAVAFGVPSELNALDTAPNVGVPAVFITCADDRIVPPAFQAKVFEAYAGTKHLVTVPGAGHNDELPAAAEAEIASRLSALLALPPTK